MSKFWHFFDEIFYVIWHLKLLGGCQFQKHPLQCTVYILRPLPPHLDNGLDLGLEALRRLQQPSNCWTRVFPMLKHTTHCSVGLFGGKKNLEEFKQRLPVELELRTRDKIFLLQKRWEHLKNRRGIQRYAETIKTCIPLQTCPEYGGQHSWWWEGQTQPWWTNVLIRDV